MYSDGDKVALNVGFYHMANAGGRLAGTVLSRAGSFKSTNLSGLSLGVSSDGRSLPDSCRFVSHRRSGVALQPQHA